MVKICKKFRVPDKTLCYIRLDCICAARAWPALARLANEQRKPPIGFKPFALACIKYDLPQSEIAGYIDRITVLEDKFDMLVDTKMWARAADTAFKLKDENRLVQVGQRCNDQVLEKHIQEMLNRL